MHTSVSKHLEVTKQSATRNNSSYLKNTLFSVLLGSLISASCNKPDINTELPKPNNVTAENGVLVIYGVRPKLLKHNGITIDGNSQIHYNDGVLCESIGNGRFPDRDRSYHAFKYGTYIDQDGKEKKYDFRIKYDVSDPSTWNDSGTRVKPGDIMEIRVNGETEIDTLN